MSAELASCTIVDILNDVKITPYLHSGPTTVRVVSQLGNEWHADDFPLKGLSRRNPLWRRNVNNFFNPEKYWQRLNTCNYYFLGDSSIMGMSEAPDSRTMSLLLSIIHAHTWSIKQIPTNVKTGIFHLAKVFFYQVTVSSGVI